MKAGILVYSFDHAVSRRLARMLQEENLPANECNSMQQLKKTISPTVTQLIIFDVWLLEGELLVWLEYLRSLSREVPLLILLNVTLLEDVRQQVCDELVYFLTKPILHADFVATVKTILRMSVNEK